MSKIRKMENSAGELAQLEDVAPACFNVLLNLQVQIARSRWRNMHDFTHALNVITNEFEELEDAIFVAKKSIDRAEVLRALVKVAAMCCRSAEDLGLVDVAGLDLEAELDAKVGGRS